MKSIIILLLLGTALFIATNAAPMQVRGSPWPAFNRAEFQSNNEMAKTLLNLFSNVLSSIGKRIGENGEIPSDEYGKVFTNLLSTFVSAISKKIDSDGKIQSDEIIQTALNTFLSTVGKNVDPNDEVEQTFLNTVKTVFSLLDKNIGNSQDADKQWFVPRSNQGTDFGDNTAIVEAFMNLSDEARAEVFPIVPMIISGLASDFVNRLLNG